MRPAVLLLVAALPLACDFPTEIPRYNTSWDVVVARDSVATAELLPESMRISQDGFVLDSFSGTSDIRLGEVCELCTCFEGPIPPLEIEPHDWPVRLPGGLVQATLERGRAEVAIENQVGFDLLDNGNGGLGFLAVDLTDIRDLSVLDQIHLVEPFPPGDTLRLSFDLGGLELSPYLVARVSGSTPGSGCDDVPLTPESGFHTEVELRDVLARKVEVLVSDQALALPNHRYELPIVLTDRFRQGETQLEVEALVESSLPAEVEIVVSLAGRPEDLFTSRAALYTPVLIPAGSPDAPTTVRRVYVVQSGPLHGAEGLYTATRNRFVDRGLMELEGGESVSYQIRVRAEVPTR